MTGWQISAIVAVLPGSLDGSLPEQRSTKQSRRSSRARRGACTEVSVLTLTAARFHLRPLHLRRGPHCAAWIQHRQARGLLHNDHFPGHTVIFIRLNSGGFSCNSQQRLVKWEDRVTLADALIRREARTIYPPGTIKCVYAYYDSVHIEGGFAARVTLAKDYDMGDAVLEYHPQLEPPLLVKTSAPVLPAPALLA